MTSPILNASSAISPMTEPRHVGGFHYYVSNRQLRAFLSRTPGQRLRWLEEMREFTAKMASVSTKRWWKKLRSGEPWTPSEVDE